MVFSSIPSSIRNKNKEGESTEVTEKKEEKSLLFKICHCNFNDFEQHNFRKGRFFSFHTRNETHSNYSPCIKHFGKTTEEF